MKVSFDFDGSLARGSLQEYARELVDSGYDVHIVTARYDSLERYTDDFLIKYHIKDIEREHNHLFDVAQYIGIKSENIHFTSMVPKYLFFVENPDFIWHLDDDIVEVESINDKCRTRAIDCNRHNDWKKECNKILNINND